MTERILTLGELNRATLARQLLLERASFGPLEAIERLVGLQGQVHNAPYIGLWTRLQSFQRADLTRLLEHRQIVKATLMRCTLHLMTADDYVLLRLALQPALSRALHPFFARQTNGIDSDQFAALVRVYIQEQPRTGVELRAKFAEFFPGIKNLAHMGDGIRAHMPLVQVFPSGTWGFTGRPAYTEASSWLGRPLAAPEVGLRHLILRYLAAFGPASVRDIQAWSGLTRLQGAIEELRPELRTFRDEQGSELFDLPDAPLPSAERPAPVRFLPEFDNLLLAHADRRRVVADEYRPFVFIGNAGVRGTFLVDGFVHGAWKIERTPASATLVIEPFEPLSDTVRQDLLSEGERLMRWVSDGAETFEIQFSALPVKGL